jgi:hypothetical protein
MCPMPELVYSIQELIAWLCPTKTFGIRYRAIYSHGWVQRHEVHRLPPRQLSGLTQRRVTQKQQRVVVHGQLREEKRLSFLNNGSRKKSSDENISGKFEARA